MYNKITRSRFEFKWRIKLCFVMLSDSKSGMACVRDSEDVQCVMTRRVRLQLTKPLECKALLISSIYRCYKEGVILAYYPALSVKLADESDQVAYCSLTDMAPRVSSTHQISRIAWCRTTFC